MGRTAQTAATWSAAWPPAPSMASTRLSGAASRSVARPLAAPVRSAVNDSPSRSAGICPVSASIQSTTPPMLGSPRSRAFSGKLITLITPLPETCSTGMTSTRCPASEVRSGPVTSPRVAAANPRRVASIASAIGTRPRSSAAPIVTGKLDARCAVSCRLIA